MALETGESPLHYRVVDKLGAGGMGDVYRARDLKLEREVALKVLPAEMASDPSRLSRFQREAKTIAGLNHPSIVTIFSVEEAEGVHFLTMELVEGKSISEFLPERGFGLDRAIDRGMINYPFLTGHDRYLDNIRGEARFGQAMERARPEWERFQA